MTNPVYLITESAKFLGHGLCDSHSKCSTLSIPTNDATVIKREASILMRFLNVEPKDLRGVGIQISKLEKPKDGQQQTKSILNFMTKVIPSGSNAGNEQVDNINVISTEKTVKTVTEKTNKIVEQSEESSSNLVSSFQSMNDIDEDVLKELPEDIRKEIENERKKFKKQEINSFYAKKQYIICMLCDFMKCLRFFTNWAPFLGCLCPL